MLLRLYSLVRNSRYQAFHKYWQNGLIFKWLNSFLYIRQRYLKKNTGWKCVSLQAWSVIYKVSANCCAKISITSWHEIYVGGEEFHNINFPSVLLEWKLKKAAADHKRYFRDFWLHLVFLQVEKKKTNSGELDIVYLISLALQHQVAGVTLQTALFPRNGGVTVNSNQLYVIKTH